MKLDKKCFGLHKSSMAIEVASDFINLSGRVCKYVLPTSRVRKLERQKYITVGDLQETAAFWSHQVSKSTVRRHLHANKLFGRHARRKKILSSNHKSKCLEVCECYWNFD